LKREKSEEKIEIEQEPESSYTAPWLPKPSKPKKLEQIETYPEDPVEFCCPISRSVMVDPVIATDGKTYERKEILRWLENNNTSPFTKQPMSSRDLKENLELKQQISLWLAEKSSLNSKKSEIISETKSSHKENDTLRIASTNDDTDDYVAVEEDE